MGRLIDADKFILAIMDASLSSVDEDTILDLIDSVPTVDAVPVVRCVVCQWAKPKNKKFFVLGVRGGERQYMLGMQGQPARADPFISSSFPNGRGFGSALTGTICRCSSTGRAELWNAIARTTQVQVLPSAQNRSAAALSAALLPFGAGKVCYVRPRGGGW